MLLVQSLYEARIPSDQVRIAVNEVDGQRRGADPVDHLALELQA